MSQRSVLRRVAAWSAYLAPPLLMASDVLLVMFISTPGLLLQRLAMLLYVIASIGLAVFGRAGGRWLVPAGALLAAVGAAAIHFAPGTLVVPLRVPAALFPVGLLIASAGMLGPAFPRYVAPLMGAGALLFPVGHLSGSAVVLIVSDVALLVAFWSLARYPIGTPAPLTHINS